MDVDVNKASQDLRINNPKLEGKRIFVSSGSSQGNKVQILSRFLGPWLLNSRDILYSIIGN